MGLKEKFNYHYKYPNDVENIYSLNIDSSTKALFFGGGSNVERTDFNAIIEMIFNFSDEGELVYKNSRNVLRSFPISSKFNIPSRRLVIKKFGQNNFYDNIRFRLFSSRAVRSLSTAYSLKELKINVPKPVVAVEFRENFRKLINSFYVCEFIDFDFNLWTVYQKASRKRQKLLLFNLATLLKKMHDSGIIHGDLQPNNIHFTKHTNKEEKEKIQTYLLDFNRASRAKDLSDKIIAKDLSRLRLPDDLINLFLSFYRKEDTKKLETLIRKHLNSINKRKSFKNSLKNIFFADDQS
ncbi:lipopolysaccharide kinase InaA family protein [Halarsenatibacter silvermanii]|uniref:tRNA A-37 threonylcarbamoyl transferase component Bud32 n=1 Tax=Halarsenatibacter silvermanii TaxID=321763 RepID=A0A1G9HZQ5_9FIRM|nr:lipopolysaccharide kinase InaA family protein [Halarsenatibacter silvermanii]SDL18448.1 tRNA A-37 threonylcarbamoyl transferase component Bud32 [Halarsenatibacter silvermanii]